jgi:hypothetical protein
MPKGNVGPSVKDPRLYKVLRQEGIKKAKALRIATAVAGPSASRASTQSRRSAAYDKWTKSQLLARARKVGVKGRSSMRKTELVKALRRPRLDLAVSNAGSATLPTGLGCRWTQPALALAPPSPGL